MATATKPQRGEKTAFIRQHPTLKAAELVAEGKKAGIKLTATQIYNCRAVDKKKGKKGKRNKAATNGAVHRHGYRTRPGCRGCHGEEIGER